MRFSQFTSKSEKSIRLKQTTLSYIKISIFVLIVLIISTSAIYAAPQYLQEMPRVIVITAGLILSTLLLSISKYDIDYLCIPPGKCFIGIIIGILVIIINGFYNDMQYFLLIDHLKASIIGLIFMEVLSRISLKIMEYESLGLGDAKLAAVGGAWLGTEGLITAISISFILSALFTILGLFSGKLRMRQAFPFGPFLALGIWSVWLAEPNWWLLRWHNLLGI